jgi:Putative peptidoglycan binding domain
MALDRFSVAGSPVDPSEFSAPIDRSVVTVAGTFWVVGVPRDQLTVPICRTAVLSDESLYDSPSGAGLFYVPRWRVVDPAGRVPQIALQQSATGWSMTVRMEPYPAPAIADQVAQAQVLGSSDDVVLRYTLVPAAGRGQGAIVQEVHPSSVVADGSGLVVTFSGTQNADLDQLYGAMTDNSHGTVLVVRRTVTAAVLAAVRGFPPIWSNVPVEAAPRLAGPIITPLAQPVSDAVLRPVIDRPSPAGGLMVMIPPRPLPVLPPEPGPVPSPGGPRYWVRSAVLEDASSFYYPADRYPSIYEGITTGTPTYTRTRHYVPFQDQMFPYYQADAIRFNYLPDSFRLARTLSTPHVPMLQIDPQGVGGSADKISVNFGFVALPYVSAERIADAAEQLRVFAPGPYPPGVTGPILQPLLVTPDALSLQLVAGDTVPSGAGAVLSLRTGIVGQLTLTLNQFQAAYNALFAGLALLTGNVVIDLGGANATETVPIALRVASTWGPVLDSVDQPVSDTAVRVTLTNATESPVRIDAVTGAMWRDGPGQASDIQVPVSAAPASTPPSPSAQIAENGFLDTATTTALQRGLAANGWYPASAVDGDFGANTATGLQRWLRVAADGDLGPQTVRALQGMVGATVNGIWESVTRPHTARPGVRSDTTLRLQHALNAGILTPKSPPPALSLPVTLAPGDHVALIAAAPGGLPGAGTLRARVDPLYVIQADPHAVWDMVFSHAVPAVTQYQVSVRVPSDIFAARTDPPPHPALKAVTVTFETGTVVTFDVKDVRTTGSSSFITNSATLPVSLRDYVLAGGGAPTYRYRVAALTADDRTVADSADRTSNIDTLDVTLPAFPAAGP